MVSLLFWFNFHSQRPFVTINPTPLASLLLCEKARCTCIRFYYLETKTETTKIPTTADVELFFVLQVSLGVGKTPVGRFSWHTHDQACKQRTVFGCNFLRFLVIPAIFHGALHMKMFRQYIPFPGSLCSAFSYAGG